MKQTLITAIGTLVVLSSLWPAFAQSDSSAQKEAGKNNSAKVVIFCAPAVEAGSQTKIQNTWLAAVMSRYIPQRLASASSLGLLTQDSLPARSTGRMRYGERYDEKTVFAAAVKQGATHALIHTYGFEGKESRLTYFLELVRLSDRSVLYTIDESFSITRAGSTLDKHFVKMLVALNAPANENYTKNLKRTIVDSKEKTLKLLGQAIEGAAAGDAPPKSLEKFKKVIAADMNLTLAYLEAATVARMAGNAAEAAALIYSVITRSGLSYPELYLGASADYRAAAQPDMSQRILLFAREAGWDTPHMLVEKALILQAQGNLEQAQITFRQVRLILPENPHALLFLARLHNDRAQSDSALLLCTQLAEHPLFAAAASLEQARAHLQKNELDKTEVALNRAAQHSPIDPQVHLYRAHLLNKQENFSKAAGYYEKALGGLPNNLDILLSAVHAYRKAGQNPMALALLKKSASQFYNAKIVTLETGLLELEQGDTISARRKLETCLNIEPADGRVFLAMGTIYASAKETDKAIEAFDRAIALLPQADQARIELAALHLSRGNASRSEQILQTVTSEGLTHKRYNRVRGDFAWTKGDFAEARKYYLAQRDQFGNELTLQKRLADIAFKQNDLPAAQKEADKLIELAPSEPGVYYRRAIIAQRRKLHSDATTFLAQAQLLGAPDSGVYLELSAGFAAAAQYGQAIELLLKELVSNPQSQQALKALADSYLKTGADTLAGATYLKLYQTDKQANSNYLAQAGHLFLGKGATPRAQAAYELFLADGHSNDKVRINAARLAFERKDFPAVLSALDPLYLTPSSPVEQTRMYALSLAAQGDLKKTYPFVVKLSAQHPADREIAELAARTYENAQNLAQACAMYERYLSLGKTEQSADYAYHLGTLYEKRGLISQAQARYEKNIAQFPDDLRNYHTLLTIYLKKRQTSAATALLKKASARKNPSPELLLELARMEIRAGQNASGEKAYSTYLKLQPGDSAVWYELAQLYYQSRRYSAAIAPLLRSSTLMPDRAQVWYELGDTYLRADSAARAASPLEKSLALDPRNTRYAGRLQDCYLVQRDTSRLITTIERRAQLEPDNFALITHLGTLYLATHSIDNAIKTLETASRLKPSDVGIHTMLIELYRRKGDNALRGAHIDAALAHAPKSSNLHLEKGLHLHESDRHDQAQISFERAVALNPSLHEAWFMLGTLFKEAGQPGKARLQFANAARLAPTRADYQLEYAISSHLSADSKTAVPAINKALFLKPDQPDIVRWGGLIHAATGNLLKADTLLNRALVLDNNCTACYEQLGRIAYSKGSYERSIDYLKKAIVSQPSDSALVLLGNAYLYKGDSRAASTSFEKAFSINPHNSEALYQICVSLIEKGSLEQAATILDNNKTPAPSGWIPLAQGRILEEQNNSAGAIISYGVAVKFMPLHIDAHLGLGRSFLLQKRYTNAYTSFAKAVSLEPSNPYALTGRGESQDGTNKLAAAAADYAKAATILPSHPRAALLAGTAYNRLKQFSNASAMLKLAATHHDRNGSVHFQQALAQKGLSKYKDALDSFEKAAKLDTQQYGITANRMAGDIAYDKLKDNRAAKKFYLRFIDAGGEDPSIKSLLSKL